jgi:membrane protease YdiL (CAAX protease family)
MVTSTGARQRAGAMLECLAVLALPFGVRPAARSIGITTYSGPLAIVLAVALATVLLARRGESWRSLGLARPPHLRRTAAWAIGTFLVLMLSLPPVLQTIATALALPPQDLGRLGDIRHDTVRYLVVQALLFGLGHVYLGPRGVMNAAAIGLVMGGVYWASGRNLWPLIIAHGLVDSVSLTVLRLGVAHQG